MDGSTEVVSTIVRYVGGLMREGACDGWCFGDRYRFERRVFTRVHQELDKGLSVDSRLGLWNALGPVLEEYSGVVGCVRFLRLIESDLLFGN